MIRSNESKGKRKAAATSSGSSLLSIRGGAKLGVSQTGDAHEREAERMAQRVQSSRPGTEPAAEATAKRSPSSAPQGLLQELGPGRALDRGVRAKLEPHLGQDLKEVRVHTGTQAEEAANAVEARAFTVGRDVVFGASQYKPGTREGLALLAHEVTHVAQQAATGTPALQRAPKQPAQFESPTTKKAGYGDLIKAFLELSEVKKAIDAIIQQLKSMPPEAKTAGVLGITAIGAGALSGLANNAEARKEVFGLLHGQEISIPRVPGLSVQILTKDAPPTFDPKSPPKPEISTPTGQGAMLKFEKKF